MRVFKATYCIALLCLPFFLFAQINTIKFEHYASNEGLSYDNVKCIQQDTLGFLWVGTLNGLNRYDGIQFIQYSHDPQDSTSLSNDNITKLYEDRKGNLWVGTVKGLNLFNREKDQFKRFTFQTKEGINASQNYIQDILEDTRGNLWIATKKGAFLFRPEEGSFKSFYVTAEGIKRGNIAGNNVRCLFEDSNQRLWVGFFGLNGLQYYNHSDKTFVSTLYNPDEPGQLLNISISDIFEDSKGNFWLGSRDKGLLLYDRATNTFETFQKGFFPNNINSNTIWSLEEDNNENLLIGTDDGGLNTLNLNNNDFQFTSYKVEFTNSYSISSNTLLSLYKDRTGLIWIGTLEGLNKIDPGIQKFTHYQSGRGMGNNLSSPDVSSILEDYDGNVWVGTFKGLNRINQTRSKIDHFHHQYYIDRSLSSAHVQCLLQDKNLDIWIGTSGGLDKISYPNNNKDNPRIQRFSEQKRNLSLSHPNIRSLLEDSKRQLWVGTEDGLNVLDRRRDKVRYFFRDPKDKRSISNDQIRCMLEDKRGNIWLGTEEGLNIYNPKTEKFKRFLKSNGLNNDLIYCLYEDMSGTIWAGTPGGLNKINQEGSNIYFDTYNVKNGFADNAVHAIQEDKEGTLWLSTNKGITSFNPRKQKDNVKNYNYQDGLQDSQFKSNASYKGKTGELFFGGKDGLNIFNPATLSANDMPPKVVITDFKLNYKNVPIRPDSKLENHISVADEVVLSSSDRSVYFEFAALNYTLPEKNSYAYKLDNFDDTWQTGSNNSVSYTNLDPGSYTFMVKAANNDGKWNEEPTTLTVIMKPTLVQTVYFRVGAFLALLGLSYLLFKTRVRQLQRNQQQLEETVRERTQQLQNRKEELEKTLETLNATQNQLLTSEKMASLGQLTAGIAHEINNPINFISSNVQALKMDFKDVQDVLEKVKALENHPDIKQGISELLQVGKQLDVQLLQKEIEELLAGIERGTDRTVSIVKSLRTFSRNSNETFMPADIHEGIDSTLTILNSQFNGHINVVKKYSSLPAVDCQIGRINQVFLNIINNAIHAIDAHPLGEQYAGEIEISTAQNNGHVHIEIADNGVGMDTSTQNRIFEPFYTTKDVGEGTGLGLSISYGIIEQHGGSLKFESQEGTGTSFYITLPISQNA